MTRQEYLEKMQAYREELQANAKKKNEVLDRLNDQYRQDLTDLNQKKRNEERKIRDEHQSAQEHPVNEIRIVE